MPELSVILIIGGITALVFGSGVVTAARYLTARGKSKSEE